MIIYKINKDGWVASFKVAGRRMNVLANDRLSAIRMAIDYITNVKG